jgi:hypothetical protein
VLGVNPEVFTLVPALGVVTVEVVCLLVFFPVNLDALEVWFTICLAMTTKGVGVTNLHLLANSWHG